MKNTERKEEDILDSTKNLHLLSYMKLLYFYSKNFINANKYKLT